jgi:hypothetical protein
MLLLLLMAVADVAVVAVDVAAVEVIVLPRLLRFP